jgi:phage/plasmid-associated DNA primase
MSKAEEVKAARIKVLLSETGYRFLTFKGSAFMGGAGTNGIVPFDRQLFGQIVHSHFEGITENMIDDFAKTIRTIAPDWSKYDNFIGFRDRVWDMRKLAFVDDQMEFVYSSNTALQPNGSTGYNLAWTFMLELAQGDNLLAHDYLQSIAPIAMSRKPTGIIWFIGDGANGKSSLIDALYRLLGKHFVSMTTAAIEDGRDTPRLNGVLGNIVRESSETRVEDTERYKAIGTHEPFTVHKFNSQDTIVVDTSFHTIFNANNVPVFSDKTKGARRRTLVIPFLAHFEDNPTFDDETFTDEFLGGLATLILEEAIIIRDNGYRYSWSDATLKAKEVYDSEVNSAEAFIEYLREHKIVGFYNYSMLKANYEMWCGQAGLIPLGMMTLKRTMVLSVNPQRKTIRDEGRIVSRYFFDECIEEELTWIPDGYGLITPKEEQMPVQLPMEVASKIEADWGKQQ